MRTADFHYELPEELIAQFPPTERTGSRLLVLGRGGDAKDAMFADLAGYLRPGDLMVFNDTRVMPARMHARKETGGRCEVLVERVFDARRALCHLRASKTPRPGGALLLGAVRLEVVARHGDLFELVSTGPDFQALMEHHGHMPLPPYITREDGELDTSRYQTVYARRSGAVAAPTAGLHFDTAMLDRLAELGVASTHVTLHVGAGTFQPVRVAEVGDHVMHREWLEVGAETCAAVRRTRARGGRVVAVGTTSVRSLETAAAGGELAPYRGETQLFITPGYRFRAVDMLLTNFHLPESTLLMLVSAFGGYAAVMEAYAHAVREKYRFFSYGDAMLLERA